MSFAVFLQKIFPPKRTYTLPQHQIWVDAFSIRVPTKENLVAESRYIGAKILEVDFPPFTASELSKVHEGESKDNETFLVEKLGLSIPIEEALWKFASGVSPRYHEIPSHVWKMMRPIVYRLICRYSYQFHTLLQGHLLQDVLDDPLVQHIPDMIPLVFVVPKHKTCTGPLCAGQFLENLKAILRSCDLFVRNPRVADLTNFIFTCASSILMSSPVIPDSHYQLLELCIEYFLYHSQMFSQLDPIDTYIQSLASGMIVMKRVPQKWLKAKKESIVTPVIDGCMNLAGFCETEGSNKVPADFLNLFYVEMFGLLDFFATADPDIHFENVNRLLSPIVFYLSKSPIVRGSFDEDLMSRDYSDVIPRDIIQEAKDNPVREFEFLKGKTFSKRIRTAYQYNEENEVKGKHIELFSEEGNQFLPNCVCPLIAESKMIRTLFTQVSRLLKDVDLTVLHDFCRSMVEVIGKFIHDDRGGYEFIENRRELGMTLHLFLVELLGNIPISRTCELFFREQPLCEKVFRKYFFRPRVNSWTPCGDYGESVKIVRKSIQRLAGLCFTYGSTNEELYKYSLMIINRINNLMSSVELPVFSDLIDLVLRLFRTSPLTFMQSAGETGFLELIVGRMMDLRCIHVIVHERSNVPEYLPICIAKCRKNLFKLLDEFLRSNDGKICIFRRPLCIKYFYQCLFEDCVVDYASDILKRGLMLNSDNVEEKDRYNQFDLVLKQFFEFLDETLKNLKNEDWIRLVSTLLGGMRDALAVNRNAIYSYIQSNKGLYYIASVAQKLVESNPERMFMNDPDKHIQDTVDTKGNIYYQVIEDVLDIFVEISVESLPYQQTLTLEKEHTQILLQTLSTIRFGEAIFDKLLFLILERPISVQKLPSSVPIRNQYALPFVLQATKHTAWIEQLLSLLMSACENSVSNKLRLFQAQIPDLLIDFIEQYPGDEDKEPVVANALSGALLLFSVVSQYVFGLPTLFRCIRAMREPAPRARYKWTPQLVSLFSMFLQDSANLTPSAFFYLDGRHTGFNLPPIPKKPVARGWTFMCRFELDSAVSESTQLFFVRFENGSSLEIGFVRSKIRVMYDYPKEAITWSTVIDELELASNRWYDLIFVSDMSLYVCQLGTDDIKTFKWKVSFDLRDGFLYPSVGNTPDAVSASQESPMVANISTIYIFSGLIRADGVRLLMSLPLSFVFGFSPSELAINPKLPQALFTGEYENMMLFGANARMTGNQTCFNISTTSSVDKGTFRGHAYPYSMSFIDVIAYGGGVKLFLPLFNQVNSRVDAAVDNTSYLCQLLYLFQHFFAKSAPLCDEFVRSDGFKALAYALLKIEICYITIDVICGLADIWKVLDSVESKSAMLRDIWLDFNLWKRLPTDVQQFIYETVLPHKVRTTDEALFKSLMPVHELCAIIYAQPLCELRSHLWCLLDTLAMMEWTDLAQDTLFSYAITSRTHVTFQLEALTKLRDLCSCLPLRAADLFKRTGRFDPYLQLLMSDEECIRLVAIEMLFIVRQDLSDVTSDMFDNVIISAVSIINEKGITDKTWDLLMKYAFKDDDFAPTMRFVFPFICAVSHYFPVEKNVEFIENIVSMIEIDPPASCAITDCDLWYLWSTFLFIQCSPDKLSFDVNHPMVGLIGRICAYLFYKSAQRVDAFVPALQFFKSLALSRQWNTSRLVHNILLEVLTKSDPTSEASILIIFEVTLFLFFVPDIEKFAVNVELNNLHKIETRDNLHDEITGRMSLSDFMKGGFWFDEKMSFCFNMRFDEEGDWIDIDLACRLVEFISQNPDLVGAVLPQFSKVKVADLFVYLISFIMVSTRDRDVVQSMCTHYHAFFDEKPAEVIWVKMLMWASLRAYVRDPALHAVLLGFLAADPSLTPTMRALMSGINLDSPDFRVSVSEYGFDIALWLEQMKSNEGIASALWSSRRSLCYPPIGQAVNGYRMEFTVSDYGAAMSESNMAMSRKQRRDRGIAAKIFRRFIRQLSLNGGPWCRDTSTMYWKLAPRTDSHMRHLFMTSNHNFDIHKGASLRRDQARNEQTMLEYERWIEQHREDVGSIADLSCEMDDEDQPERQSRIQIEANLITIATVYDGSFYLSDTELCFDGIQANGDHKSLLDVRNSKTIQIRLEELTWVLHRSYLHLDKGLEFFVRDGRSYFFFFGKGGRQDVLRFLSSVKLPNSNMIIQRVSSARFVSEQKLTEKWQAHKISTYDYLMMLNLFAGRSFNDLSQYPVFPWIIADYTSPTLDLNNPATFRDLSKPIGALNEDRLEKLKLHCMEIDNASDRCLYRCHYSTAYYVLHYLVRVEPFTTMHINMQDGKFDHTNRMFLSVKRAWDSITSSSNDYRELIPEFFSLPDLLLNKNHFDLGLEDSDVELPKWASSAHDFITKHRMALESEYVSHHINEWIDLIFGFKQTGDAMWEADNAFHPHCYSNSIKSSVMRDPAALSAIQCHAGSFGIIPRQLFTNPHPRRHVSSPNEPVMQFQSLKCKLTGDAVYLSARNQSLFLVTSDFMFHRIKQQQVSLSIPFGLGLGKSIAVLPKLHALVMTSPSEDSFYAFSFDSSMNLVTSYRQQFSALTTFVAVGESMLVVLSQDGTLETWMFAPQGKCEMMYRVNHHHISAVDAAASESLRMIASCDSNGKVIMCELLSGTFSRSFMLKSVPVKIMILEEGYIVTLSEKRLNNEVKSRIEIYGLDGQFLVFYDRESSVSAWCAIDRTQGESLVCAAFEDGCFVILTAQGEVRNSAQLDSAICALSYNEQTNTIYMVNRDRAILSAIV